MEKEAKSKNAKGTLIENGKKGYKIPFNVPKHILDVAYIIKYNSHIRRCVSLCIIDEAKANGIIDKDAKAYVTFMWNKFKLSVNNIGAEYPYDSDWFLNCLANGINKAVKDMEQTLMVLAEKNHEATEQKPEDTSSNP